MDEVADDRGRHQIHERLADHEGGNLTLVSPSGKSTTATLRRAAYRCPVPRAVVMDIDKKVALLE